eukprot:Amastigsp_a4144_23.p4 type:complete len:102 gc:universal Amastigsp_a4144_23:235-540(+)
MPLLAAAALWTAFAASVFLGTAAPCATVESLRSQSSCTTAPGHTMTFVSFVRSRITAPSIITQFVSLTFAPTTTCAPMLHFLTAHRSAICVSLPTQQSGPI